MTRPTWKIFFKKSVFLENKPWSLFRTSPGGLRSRSIMHTQFVISVSWLEVIDWFFSFFKKTFLLGWNPLSPFLIFLTLDSVSLSQQHTLVRCTLRRDFWVLKENLESAVCSVFEWCISYPQTQAKVFTRLDLKGPRSSVSNWRWLGFSFRLPTTKKIKLSYKTRSPNLWTLLV